jgi:hypothetical protein
LNGIERLDSSIKIKTIIKFLKSGVPRVKIGEIRSKNKQIGLNFLSLQGHTKVKPKKITTKSQTLFLSNFFFKKQILKKLTSNWKSHYFERDFCLKDFWGFLKNQGFFKGIFLNSVNNSENRIFSGKTTVLCFRTIFWHILAKFQKNPQNGSLAKSKGIFS